PLLVLVDSETMVRRVASDIPARARELMARHWPGALTLVLRAAAGVPAELTSGTGTVGVRLPAHATARALVRALGAPVTAPSANPTGAEPPTPAGAVLAHFGAALDLVLDGGPTPGGAASTVVFFFQAEDGIRGRNVTGVQTCALPISRRRRATTARRASARRTTAKAGWGGA